MKHRGPSNVFAVPAWMKNLRVREPEGTRTPDQVASSLELSILMFGPNNDRLTSIVTAAVPQVPLKRQSFIKALLKGDVVTNCQAFIDSVNKKLALLPKEEVQNAQEPEQPTPVSAQPSGDSQPFDWDTELDDGCVRKGPRSRGHRAVRAAKRGQAEA